MGTVLRAVQKGDFAPLRRSTPSIDPALQAVCLKAMALQPQNRYPTPRALAEDIERWTADEPVTAWREPLSRQTRWLGTPEPHGGDSGRRRRTDGAGRDDLRAGSPGPGQCWTEALERRTARGQHPRQRPTPTCWRPTTASGRGSTWRWTRSAVPRRGQRGPAVEGESRSRGCGPSCCAGRPTSTAGSRAC